MALHDPHEVIYLTEKEYLKSELTSDFKREYLDGQAYAMAGAGYNHNCIAVNLTRNFANHLEGKPCTPFMARNDGRFRVRSRAGSTD